MSLACVWPKQLTEVWKVNSVCHCYSYTATTGKLLRFEITGGEKNWRILLKSSISDPRSNFMTRSVNLADHIMITAVLRGRMKYPNKPSSLIYGYTLDSALNSHLTDEYQWSQIPDKSKWINQKYSLTEEESRFSVSVWKIRRNILNMCCFLRAVKSIRHLFSYLRYGWFLFRNFRQSSYLKIFLTEVSFT